LKSSNRDVEDLEKQMVCQSEESQDDERNFHSFGYGSVLSLSAHVLRQGCIDCYSAERLHDSNYGANCNQGKFYNGQNFPSDLINCPL
jgi:hypothetical protein